MNPELAGLAVVVLVLVVILSTWYGRVRRRPQGPDVGLAVFVEDQTPDDEPLVEYQLNLYGIELTEYGSHLVHRQCLIARRDGLTACADCARVMVGAA